VECQIFRALTGWGAGGYCVLPVEYLVAYGAQATYVEVIANAIPD